MYQVQNVTLLFSAASQAHSKLLELLRAVVAPSPPHPPFCALAASWLFLSLSSSPQPIVGLISWQMLFPSQSFWPFLVCTWQCLKSAGELHCLRPSPRVRSRLCCCSQIFLTVVQYRRAVEFVLLRNPTSDPTVPLSYTSKLRVSAKFLQKCLASI